MRVSTNHGTVKVYGKFPGAQYRFLTQVTTTVDDIYNPVQVFNQDGTIHHDQWAKPSSDPEWEPTVSNTGGTLYNIKIVYEDIPGGPITTIFRIWVEDTIHGLIAGEVITENELHNCYREDDDGPRVSLPTDMQMNEWYLWNSWLDYVGLPEEDYSPTAPPWNEEPGYNTFIFYGMEDGNRKTTITKPLIFSEGIDFFNILSWKTFLYKVFHRHGIWKTLMDKGYDLIF